MSYFTAYDSSDNLFIINSSVGTFFKMEWTSLFADATKFSSDITDINVCYKIIDNLIKKTSNFSILYTSDATNLYATITDSNNIIDSITITILLTDFKDLYTADAGLSDADKITDLESRLSVIGIMHSFIYA